MLTINNREKAMQFMQNGNFNEALNLFESILKNGENDSGLFYMIGQCYRYLNNYQKAIYFLNKALLDSDNPSIQLALGIAYQLNENYEESLQVLEKLIIHNQEWESLDLAFNSIALTLKKIGQYERAEKNYKQCIKIFLFNKIKELNNSSNNSIVEIVPTKNNLWIDFVNEAAIIFSQTFQDIDNLSLLQKDNKDYGGLFWTIEIIQNKRTLVFLPNFFAVLRYIITVEPTYFNTIGNLSTIYSLLGDKYKADKYLQEAQELLEEYNLRN